MEIEDPSVKDTTNRVMDLITPLGKGQRALVAPQTEKTVMLQILRSITTNHPGLFNCIVN